MNYYFIGIKTASSFSRPEVSVLVMARGVCGVWPSGGDSIDVRPPDQLQSLQTRGGVTGHSVNIKHKHKDKQGENVTMLSTDFITISSGGEKEAVTRITDL